MLPVSVILPSYNAERFIGDAIRSIIEQSLDNWELIVVDDASSDDTCGVVNSFSDLRIRLIKLEANAGYPTAMNVGLAAAAGKYIARMDADDVSAPKRLEEQFRVLENNFYSFCGVNRYRITPGGKMYVDKELPGQEVVSETWDDLYSGRRIFTDPSVMAEKERIMAVGGYRTFQRSGMDVDLWFRLMERYGPCATITKPLYGKRLEPGSIIFNPKTKIVNQVPRVLARQRQQGGLDDIQQFQHADLSKYMKAGLIQDHTGENINLGLGALVTCFFLNDFSGCSLYWKKIRASSNRNAFSLAWLVLRKILRRLRSNPYRVYTAA